MTANQVCEALRDLCCSVDLEAACSAVSRVLSGFPTFAHVSIWGNDRAQERVFFVHEFLHQPSIEDYPHCFTVHYDEGVLGQCAKREEDHSFTEADFPSLIESPEVRDLLASRGIRSAACLALPSPPEYPCCAVLLGADDICARLGEDLPFLKDIFGAFAAAYARAKSGRFEGLLQQIVESKVTSEGVAFLTTACDAVAAAFSATTFSVWAVEGNQVVPKHFSQPHEAQPYSLGVGLTGHVAQTGNPIFLHVLTDSERVYGVKWAGLVSDYEAGPPDESDHIMLVPLVYPRGAGQVPTVNGLIRFVGAARRPSFWPIDFTRALSIAKVLSVLRYQEHLLSGEEANSRMLKHLLTLVYKARAADSIEAISDSFLREIQSWPGVSHAALVERSGNGYNLERCTFLSGGIRERCRELLAADPSKTLKPAERVRVWPVRDQETQHAVIVADLEHPDDPYCTTWVQLTGQILGSFYAISALLTERARLMRDNEEKEMAALAGAVSRIYAHEMINGCKAVRSWAKQAQRKAPNYEALLARVDEMFEHVNELLNATGFLKLTKRVCVFNTELEHFLNRLGLRHGAVLQGCKIDLSISGHRHRKVYIDPNTLLGVIHNLVLNAQEHYALRGHRGPIEIRITERKIADRAYVGFTVTDYAVGIPPENLKHVWDYGFTTKGQEGKGLGLAIVKRLVEECAGKVEVASTLGHYTTFVVLYPVEREGAPE